VEKEDPKLLPFPLRLPVPVSLEGDLCLCKCEGMVVLHIARLNVVSGPTN